MRTLAIVLACITASCYTQDPAPIIPQQAKSVTSPSIWGVVKAEGLRRGGWRVDPVFDGVPVDPTMDDRAVGDSGELQWALIQIVRWPAEATPPSAPKSAKIRIKDHRFMPHVMGVGIGRPVTFINENEHLYVVQGDVQKSSEFHAAVQEKGDQLTHSFAGPSRVLRIKESVHPWMKAWVALVPHGWFAVTDENGRYEIKGLEPGVYVVETWHQKFEPTRMNVKVSGDKPTRANILLSILK